MPQEPPGFPQHHFQSAAALLRSCGINASLECGARDGNWWEGFCHPSKFIFYNCSSCTQGHRVPGPIPPVWGAEGGAAWTRSIAGVTRRDKQPSAVTLPLWSRQFRVFSLALLFFEKTWKKGASIGRESDAARWGEHNAECQIKTEISPRVEHIGQTSPRSRAEGEKKNKSYINQITGVCVECHDDTQQTHTGISKNCFPVFRLRRNHIQEDKYLMGRLYVIDTDGGER